MNFSNVLKKNVKTKMLSTAASLAIAVSMSFSSVAWADDSERIKQLEEQLQKALGTIESMQSDIKSIRRSSGSSDWNSGDVSERLEEVENVVFDLEEKVGSRSVVNAFDAQSLDIGGFLHSTFTHVEGEDGSASSFNRNVFEILIKANLSEELSAFFASAFLREAGPSFTDAGGRRDPAFIFGGGTGNNATNAVQVIAWGNWKFSDAANLQFGRFITPHGIINIEHFPAILLDPEQPQFLRPFGGDTIFPNFVTGAQFHGKQFVNGNDTVKYNLYAAIRQSEAESILYGGRLEYGFTEPGVYIGANYLTGDRNDNELTDSDYSVYGFDLKIDNGPILWKTEVFFTDEDLGNDRFAFYTQPAYRVNDRWTVFYRYDYLDEGLNNGDSIENVIGVNYLPIDRLRLRATATNREFKSGGGFGDADAQIYQLSATLSF
jgi:hypothetical protein